MIPPLVPHETHPHSLLPPGIYQTSLDAFHERFVRGFPNSTTRRDIFAGFARLKGEITRVPLAGYHILDGSFVTGKENPADLDVLTVIPIESINAVHPLARGVVGHLLAGREESEKEYRCHTFLLVEVPLGHRDHAQFLKDYDYWVKLFGQTNRKKTGVEVPKGVVSIRIDDQDFDQISGPPSPGEEIIMRSKLPLPEDDTHWDSDTLCAQLDHVKESLSYYQALDDDSFAVALQIESLQNTARRLEAEIERASLIESEYYAIASFVGGPADQHELSASLLGKFLLLLQDLSTHLTVGNAPHRLNVSPVRGSFKIQLRLIETPKPAKKTKQRKPKEGQEDLGLEAASSESVPVGRPGIDVINDLLASSTDKEVIEDLLTTKAMKRHYSEMMKTINENGLSLNFKTRGNLAGTSISPRQAQEIHDWLNQTHSSESKIVVRGELVGANLKTGNFQIDGIAEGEREIRAFYGGATKEAREQMRGLRLGDSVRAVIVTTVVDHINFDAPDTKQKIERIETTNVLDLG